MIEERWTRIEERGTMTNAPLSQRNAFFVVVNTFPPRFLAKRMSTTYVCLRSCETCPPRTCFVFFVLKTPSHGRDLTLE